MSTDLLQEFKVFKPQLSEDSNKLSRPITFPKLVSPKLDGIRMATVDGKALTRSLKRIPNDYVANLVESTAASHMLDGELIVGPPNAGDVYSQTFSGVMSKAGTPRFVFYVFDDLSCLDLPFWRRMEVLHRKLLDFPCWIKVLPQTLVQRQEELDELYNKLVLEGYEGLMARNPDSLYKFGRCTVASQDSLKVKPFTDMEAEVIDVYEAMENQNEEFTNELGYTDRSSHAANKVGKGMAGGFTARDVATGVVFKCSAGRLTHAERVAIWEGKETFQGKLITYRSFSVGVKDKPRHPRFLKWRSELDLS